MPPAPVIDSAEELLIQNFDDMWTVEGPWLQRLVATVNFSDYESRMYFDRVLREAGVYQRMEEMASRTEIPSACMILCLNIKTENHGRAQALP